jgi:glycosyltransferase involved in cell wall biosynthesis
MTTPLVSVVLCGFDQGQYLAQAIESVLGQTYPHIELVVVDNGSTDDSREIARRYGHLPNVKLLLHEQGANVTTRSNEGIAASSGEFISFLYADDWYLPNKTELQMAAFASLPDDYGVVYAPGFRRNVETGAQWVDDTPTWSGRVLEPMLRDYHRAWLNMDSPLARRECFLRYPFHEEIFQEGEGIYLRFALSYRFHPLREPNVVMRELRGNLGKAYEPQTRWNMVVLERLQQDARFPPSLVPVLDRVRATSLRNLGWQMARLAGDPAKGRTYLMESLRWRRRDALHPRFVAGLALSALPRPVLRGVNRIANRLRHHRENVDVVTTLGLTE